MTEKLQEQLEDLAKQILVEGKKTEETEEDEKEKTSDDSEVSDLNDKEPVSESKYKVKLKETDDGDADDVDGDTDEDEEEGKKEVNEDIEAIFAGTDLSESFKEKAELIFEAAVDARVNAEVARLEETAQKQVDSLIIEAKAELVEQADAYTTAAVNEWLEENKLAVENGLKLQIAESFLSDLKDLMEKHNIGISDEKIDLAEKLQVQLDDLTEELNESVNVIMGLRSEKLQLQKQIVVGELVEGLTVSQAEKIKALAEKVEDTDLESFTGKVKALKESYVDVAEKVKEEVVNESVTTKPLTKGDVLKKYKR